jgi:hypothetical protein
MALQCRDFASTAETAKPKYAWARTPLALRNRFALRSAAPPATLRRSLNERLKIISNHRKFKKCPKSSWRFPDKYVAFLIFTRAANIKKAGISPDLPDNPKTD